MILRSDNVCYHTKYSGSTKESEDNFNNKCLAYLVPITEKDHLFEIENARVFRYLLIYIVYPF